MLSIHGLVKITAVEPLKKIKDQFYVLNMKVKSFSKKREADGSYSNRFDAYDAFCFFTSKNMADLWMPQLVTGRVLDLRWASLQGATKDSDGQEKGRTQIRIYPNINHTMPKERIRDGTI